MIRDWPLRILTGAAALGAVAALALIVGEVVVKGCGGLSFSFLTEGVEDGGRAGGIGPILVSTGAILLCSLIPAVSLGVTTALCLEETVGRDSRGGCWLMRSIDLLASVPSIIFGLFGMVFFCQALGLGFSILSGGLTLACMILPLIIRTSLTALQGLPVELRLGAAALGLSQSATIFRILLPAAAPGIEVGISIALARALAETAALIFTSGYATRLPATVFDSGRALSVHIYDLALNVSSGSTPAATAALVLLSLVFVLNNLVVSFVEKKAASHRGLQENG